MFVYRNDSPLVVHCVAVWSSTLQVHFNKLLKIVYR